MASCRGCTGRIGRRPRVRLSASSATCGRAFTCRWRASSAPRDSRSIATPQRPGRNLAARGRQRTRARDHRRNPIGASRAGARAAVLARYVGAQGRPLRQLDLCGATRASSSRGQCGARYAMIGVQAPHSSTDGTSNPNVFRAFGGSREQDESLATVHRVPVRRDCHHHVGPLRSCAHMRATWKNRWCGSAASEGR